MLCVDIVCVRDTGRGGLGPGATAVLHSRRYTVLYGLSNAVCILARQLRLAAKLMSQNQDPWTSERRASRRGFLRQLRVRLRLARALEL